MSESTAIGAVSTSLRNLLDDRMEVDANVGVTILGPDEQGGNRRVNLFLYQMRESPELRNLTWQASRTEPGRLVPPPLSLNLFYLVTAYAPNDAQNGNSAQHELLGEAMRVFYEHPVVPEELLHPVLVDAHEEVRIMLNTLDPEELARVWATFSEPFRLSVLYEVSVVQLDTSPASERLLPERVRSLGVPSTEAPFRPPSLRGLDPISGPGGTEVRVVGEQLEGWRAYLRMNGQNLLQAVEIGDDDGFDFTVPDGLLPGFHEVRVDVSHLARSTFFFEVTP